jgi:hypothetical protein
VLSESTQPADHSGTRRWTAGACESLVRNNGQKSQKYVNVLVFKTG